MYNLTNISLKVTWSLDIETRVNHRADEVHEQCGDYDVKPKANLVDPAKIKADVEAKRAKVGEKDALHWGTGAIGSFALTNVDSIATAKTKDDYVIKSMVGLDEAKVLTALGEALDDPMVHVVVGENLKDFDVPYIIGRFIYHKMAVPRVLLNSYNFIDVNSLFKSSSMGSQAGSLGKKLVWAGLDDKLMKGSDVPVLFDNAVLALSDDDKEEYKKIMLKIKDYNIDDTIKVAFIFIRVLSGGCDAEKF